MRKADIETHEWEIEGIRVVTGDLICTTNGGDIIGKGEFWWLVGRLIPGEIDHVAIYTGPGARCVEAGPKGVKSFKLPGKKWAAEKLAKSRGFVDRFVGIARPLAGRKFSPEKEDEIRKRVSAYCERQLGKPYNLNFLDSDTEKSFYCSQLAYKAFLPEINLNTGRKVPKIPGTESIVYPQEVWESCERERPAQKRRNK